MGLINKNNISKIVKQSVFKNCKKSNLKTGYIVYLGNDNHDNNIGMIFLKNDFDKYKNLLTEFEDVLDSVEEGLIYFVNVSSNTSGGYLAIDYYDNDLKWKKAVDKHMYDITTVIKDKIDPKIIDKYLLLIYIASVYEKLNDKLK